MTMPEAEIVGSDVNAEADADAATLETEGSAPSGEETTAAKTDANSESPEKKRDEVNERFDKLTRDLYELRSERDRDRFEIDAREKRIKELEAKLSETAKQSQVAPDATPTLEQFGFDEAKYQAALYSHLTKTVGAKIRDEIMGEMKQTEAQRKSQETYSTWAKREADFIKSQPDYVDKVKNARSLPISEELQAELLQMDDGPQLAYYLTENREKAALLMRMPISAQMRELGRIQAQLELKKSAAPPVSKAPPPPSKVDSLDTDTRVSTSDPASDRLSDDEWFAAERRRLANKARRKA
jgi:hypothetical protein